MSSFLSWLLGFVFRGFGVGSTPDPTKAATDTGENLGKAEQANNQAQSEIENVAVANKVRADTAAAAARDPSSLRNPSEFSRD